MRTREVSQSPHCMYSPRLAYPGLVSHWLKEELDTRCGMQATYEYQQSTSVVSEGGHSMQKLHGHIEQTKPRKAHYTAFGQELKTTVGLVINFATCDPLVMTESSSPSDRVLPT